MGYLRGVNSEGIEEYVIVGCSGKNTHTNVYRAPKGSFEHDGKILVPNDAIPIVLAVLDETSQPFEINLKPKGINFEIPYRITHIIP